VLDIGEYAERIDNADELLESFLESFDDETPAVQLQMLTATVKLFLKRPAETQKMVQDVLTLATQDSDNPDLRDRGYIYWRLLSTDPEAAKQVVLAEKPHINDDSYTLDPAVLDGLITHLSTLASIYHKPPSTFIAGRTRSVPTLGAGRSDDPDMEESDANMTSDMMVDVGMGGAQAAPPPMPDRGAGGGGLIDLLGLDDELPPQPAGGVMGGASHAPQGMEDLFGAPAPAPAAASSSAKLVLEAARADGMQIRNAFVSQGGRVYQQITVENHSAAPLSGFAIQYNKNSFGLNPESPAALGQAMPQSLAPGASHTAMVPLVASGQLADSKGLIQMAIKNNVKVYYFQDACDLLAFLSAEGRIERGAFLEQWKGVAQEHRVEAHGLSAAQQNADAVCPRLEAASVFFVARRKLPDGADMVYFSVKTLNNVHMLVEVGFRPGSGTASITVKAQQTQYVALFADALKAKLLAA